jgi:AcrR family transcriptional regulator
MSQRNSNRAVILDATRDAVLDLGVRRTTFAEVGRRAGMSRMTLYRSFPDVATCVAELMTREFGALITDALEETADAADSRTRLVEATALIVDRLTSHPLWERVVDVDPELLLPYLTDRLGGTQRAGLALYLELIQAGQEEGSIRAGEPELLAFAVVNVVQPFVVSSRIIRREQDFTAVVGELRHMLDAYLRPEGPR